MAKYDPKEKYETWIFRKKKKSVDGKQLWELAKYKRVRYGQDPTGYVEPHNNELWYADKYDATGTEKYSTDDFGNIENFEFVEGDISGDPEVFSIS